MMQYEDFLATKAKVIEPSGFEPDPISNHLFEFQRDLVRWALRRGRAAVFADTGLGKSRMQIEWARQVNYRTDGDVLILAPLAVAAQTVREGESINTPVTLCREASDVRPGINITNYDRLHRFDPKRFIGVVLDESSCIKHHDAKTLATLLGAFADTKYKLCATATPAPNDYAELGTHAEFLGICSRAEMLSEFFVHDSGETQTWRLKGHARDHFWQWVATWGALLRSPADLDYDDEGYNLPPLEVILKMVRLDEATKAAVLAQCADGEVKTLSERRAARKASTEARIAACAEVMAREPDEQWLVWGDLNAETEGVARVVPDAVEVRGPDAPDVKEKALLDFAEGRIRVLVTKSSIAGFGLNFQRCARMCFVGLSDSYEAYYQAVRRCWRFGQRRPVHVYTFASDLEGNVVSNLARKEADARRMAEELSARTRAAVKEQVRAHRPHRAPYNNATRGSIPGWMKGAGNADHRAG